MNFIKSFLRGGPPLAPEYGIYRKVMNQSRQKEFYGEGRFIDSYDGRLDCLTLHMAALMDGSRYLDEQKHGDTVRASNFCQSLFDVMVKDFDTALREEGFTDSGVKRRIKPMVGRFYARLKQFTENLGDEEGLRAAIHDDGAGATDEKFVKSAARYAMKFHEELKSGDIAQIYDGSFNFPAFAN